MTETRYALLVCTKTLDLPFGGTSSYHYICSRVHPHQHFAHGYFFTENIEHAITLPLDLATQYSDHMARSVPGIEHGNITLEEVAA